MNRTSFLSATLIVLAACLPLVPFHLSAQENEMVSLATDLSRSLSKTPKHPAAVVDFTDLQGNVTLLGRFLAEELETALVNSGTRIDLVDRTRLQLILQENKLASKEGIIDPATARKLGNIAGVQILITGTVTLLDSTIRLSIKALDTEDGRVLAAVSANFRLTPAMASLGNQGPVVRPNQQQVTTQEFHDFRFDLQYCSQVGSTTECSLAVTNRGSADQELAIYGNCSWYSDRKSSRLIDAQGRENLPRILFFGSHDSHLYCFAAGTAVSGTSTKLTLSFENTPTNMTSIALLELYFQDGPRDGFFRGNKVQFRNVTVSPKRF